MKLRTPVETFEAPTRLFIARCDSASSRGELELAESYECKDTRCYFADPGPGCWMVVAALTERRAVNGELEMQKVTCLAQDGAARTRTAMASGSFAFMGRFVVDQSMRFGKADDLQRRSREALDPGGNWFVTVARWVSRQPVVWYRGALIEEARDADAADAILRQGEEDLHGYRLAPLQPAETGPGEAHPQ